MTRESTLIQDALRICRVPAPTGEEAARGRLVAEILSGRGVATETDAAGNVVAVLPGDPALPCVALAAHLDTVFPDREPLEVHRREGWLCAPGIGDNAAGVAALTCLAADLPREGLGTILFAATVGEEGLGDLRGARHLVATRGEEIDVFLAVEGGMRDALITGSVGSERLRITIRGPGGHSWGDAGTPSAIHGAAGLVTALYDLALPPEPKTTLSVGTFHGGHSINSIAEAATLELDLRSLDQETVSALRDRALALVARTFPEDAPLRAEVESVGSRPAGRIDPHHPLLEHVRAARREAGLPEAEEFPSSTDASIPLSAGIPATCVGVGLGEDGHRRTERLRIEGLAEGYEALRAAVLRIAGDPALLRRPGVR